MGIARLVVAAVVAAASLAGVLAGELPLGLDFEGGVQLRYELDAADPEGRVLEVVRERIDALGVEDVGVHRRDREVIVEAGGPSPEELAGIKAVLGRSRTLRFVAIDDEAEVPERALPAGIEVERETVPSDAGAYREVRYLAARGPDARARLVAFLGSLPAPAAGRSWSTGPLDDASPSERSWILVDGDAVGGDRIADAEVTVDEQMGVPIVFVTFDAEGGEQFAALTAKLVRRRLAIVLDGVVQSAPVVQEPIRGGRAQVTMGTRASPQEAFREARELAVSLRSGALPQPLRLAEEDLVQPTVGGGTGALGLVGAVALWLALSILALVRYGRAGLAVALGAPATVLTALALFAAMGAVLTLYSVAGVAAAVALMLACTAIALERTRRGASWVPVSLILTVVAHTGAFVVAVALFTLGAGPIRGFAAGLFLSVLGAAFYATVLTSALART